MTLGTHAATKQYVDDEISAALSALATGLYLPVAGGTLTGNLSMDGSIISFLGSALTPSSELLPGTVSSNTPTVLTMAQTPSNVVITDTLTIGASGPYTIASIDYSAKAITLSGTSFTINEWAGSAVTRNFLGATYTGEIRGLADTQVASDYAASQGYVNSRTLPIGGLAGQALVKISSSNFDYDWQGFSVLPAGGLTGQVLTKLDDTDFTVYWSDGGGGAVDSVNGFTGVVNLTASDVGAAAVAHFHTISDLTDVDLAGLADGQVLLYNASSDTWVPTSIVGVGVVFIDGGNASSVHTDSIDGGQAASVYSTSIDGGNASG